MASYGHHPQAAYGGAPMAPPAVVPPAGTFAPGTKIQVGDHRVQIQKYLSEGGFAHVYLVKMIKPVDGADLVVLKRVAVPDKEALRGMRTEVETMKRLKGHRAIVTYIDSHASELKGGGYEVFLLMEYCDGGGLIDFMNTRLQHRLTEPEILTIFADIAEGVACMHYLKPALLHRDLKVENVLITDTAAGRRFKLCDFGSAAPPRSAPTTVVECRLMDEDVQRHTTLQYRSPEMIDVYRKQPIDEKSDIWALGVLLYKLCYYTTPFEDQGQLAILNASYRCPSYPVFSDRLKKLIASMLKESMQARPNIYQVLKEACAMQGREVPIHDIYAGRPQPGARTREAAPAGEQKLQPAPVVGAVFSAPVQEKQSIPDIVPMRRGRPAPSQQQAPPSGKVTGGDPFAALDAKGALKGDCDELSSRFPRLDQFSLLHDQGSFNFDPAPSSPPLQQERSQKITERLADEVFATSRNVSANHSPAPRPQSVTPVATRPDGSSPPPDSNTLLRVSSSISQPAISRAQSIIRNNPELKAIANKTASSVYISTGTMTESSAEQQRPRDVDRNNQPPETETPRLSSSAAVTGQNAAKRQSTGNWAAANTRSSSIQPRLSQSTLASSRTSLEILSSREDLIDMGAASGAHAGRQRPASTAFESSTLEFLRERENASSRQVRSSSRHSVSNNNSGVGLKDQEALRSIRDSDPKEPDLENLSRRPDTAPTSGSKTLLAGKFGDAFKRFENNAPVETESSSRASSPHKDAGHRGLTPIEGSEATDDRSDDDSDEEEDDYMTAEMRREMERRRLEEEEARVEAAQAEYRRRVAEGSSPSKPKPPPKVGVAVRAASIQNRVQSLLSEEQKPSAVPRTAQGYGKYTDAAPAPTEAEKPRPEVRRKPVVVSKPAAANPRRSEVSLIDTRSSTATTKSQGKPPAPKKPVHLNSLSTGGRQSSPTKASQGPSFERLIALDLPGQPMLEMTGRDRDDYIEDFAKRFPSLSTIELSRAGGQENVGSRQ